MSARLRLSEAVPERMSWGNVSLISTNVFAGTLVTESFVVCPSRISTFPFRGPWAQTFIFSF